MKYRRKSKRRLFYQLHTTLGVVLALFFLVILITGVLLNHGEDFSLGRKKVKFSWLYSLYDIKAPNFLGVVKTDNFLVTATKDRIYLISQEGEMLNEYSYSDILASPVDNVGQIADQTVVFKTSSGIFKCDSAILDCSDKVSNPTDCRGGPSTSSGQMVQSPPANVECKDNVEGNCRGRAPSLPATESICINFAQDSQLLDLARQAWFAETISLEKVITDIHSGRILGFFGKLLVDLVAAGLLFLTCSGVLLWIRKFRARR